MPHPKHPADWPCLQCTVDIIAAYDRQQAKSAATRGARVLNRRSSR